MKKNIVITLLITLVIWLSSAVIRLENFHYASFVGMCNEFKTDDPLQTLKRHNCLHNKETRTSPLWHILYALQGE
jgi:hypothetical protein